MSSNPQAAVFETGAERSPQLSSHRFPAYQRQPVRYHGFGGLILVFCPLASAPATGGEPFGLRISHVEVMKEIAMPAFLIASLALLFGGCISIDLPVMNPAIHGYSGPDRPLEELAVLVVNNSKEIRISSIDGPAGPVAETALLDMAQNTHDRKNPPSIDEFHLPPGQYTIHCEYIQPDHGVPTRDQLFGDAATDQTFPVPADLLAGQVYLLGSITGSGESSSNRAPGSYLRVTLIGSVQELAPSMSAFGAAHEWEDLNQRMSATAVKEDLLQP